MPEPPGAEPVALDLRDHVAFDLSTPQLRPITAGGQLRLDLVCLEPRQVLPAATLGGDRLYTVVGGRAWAVVEDAEVVLEPLQALLVPAGAAHGVRNDSPDPLILQVVTAVAGAVAEGAAPARPPSSEEDSVEATPLQPPAAGSDRFARIRRLLGSQD